MFFVYFRLSALAAGGKENNHFLDRLEFFCKRITKMPHKRIFAQTNTSAQLSWLRGVWSVLLHFVRFIAVLPVYFYRFCISPFLPHVCKYHPSCSIYAVEAIMRHGVLKGGAFACWRVLRCNPWVDGGLDPVPPKSSRG